MLEHNNSVSCLLCIGNLFVIIIVLYLCTANKSISSQSPMFTRYFHPLHVHLFIFLWNSYSTYKGNIRLSPYMTFSFERQTKIIMNNDNRFRNKLKWEKLSSQTKQTNTKWKEKEEILAVFSFEGVFYCGQ